MSEDSLNASNPETANTITGSKAHHTISGEGIELEARNIISAPLLICVYQF